MDVQTRERPVGEKPNCRELRAVRRVEKAQEEEQRWAYYSSIPLKHWCTMSGRQIKVLKEQAARYGIPFGGATIDLAAVVRALHDFLAANARRRRAAGDHTAPAPTVVDNHPPPIAAGELYTLAEACRRLGWRVHAFREARRQGLVTIRCGRQKFVFADDILKFFRSLQPQQLQSQGGTEQGISRRDLRKLHARGELLKLERSLSTKLEELDDERNVNSAD